MSQESGEDEDGAIVVTTGTITEEVIDTMGNNRTRAEEEDITGGMGSRTSQTDQLDVLVRDGEGTRTGTRTRSWNQVVNH